MQILNMDKLKDLLLLSMYLLQDGVHHVNYENVNNSERNVTIILDLHSIKQNISRNYVCVDLYKVAY